MAKKNFLQRHFRSISQFFYTILTNSYGVGFLRGEIYTGSSKAVCVPGLNCYSCPGALGACPIGAFQAVIGSRQYHFAFYVAGFLLMIGATLGRFVCGWLCPFGFVEDLLYKIPFAGKRKYLPGDKLLKGLKYLILLLFVLLLPLLVVDIVGQGSPWFCKYICPSGTLLAGLPLVLANPALQQIVGGLFAWKLTLLAAIVLLSLWVYRPFCRYLCPLGAIYGLCNRISLLRLQVDQNRCNHCGVCQKSCKWGIAVFQQPNSCDCIRCGDCRNACPQQAIFWRFGGGRESAATNCNVIIEKDVAK